MSSQNRGKTALITGSSSGIGFELAKIFAQEGYNLVLVARSEKTLHQQADELKQKHGVSTKIIVKDLSQPGAAQEVYNEIEQAGIKIAALINNAGFATYGQFTEIKLNTEVELMELNMVTLTVLTKLFLPGMIERHEGKVLNIASTAAFQPGPLMAVYYASKAYVLSLSEALASELEGTGVTVTALCPGPTQTGFQQRAAMEESRLVSGRKIMDSATVARIGYNAMQKGKTVVVPGLKNLLMTESIRFTPRKLVTRIVKNMQARTH